MTCDESYYPEWSSRGMRAVACERQATVECFTGESKWDSDWKWRPKCGVHARMHERIGREIRALEEIARGDRT